MIYRCHVDDFRVEEIPLYPPDGEGPHCYLWIEKTGRETTEIANQLASLANCAPSDIGFAGRKDRWAVTRQWFSVPGSGSLNGDLEGARVLSRSRHAKRLRTGDLRGNRFEVVVREVTPGLSGEIERRAASVVREGFANLFGPQRFGVTGKNASDGLAVLLGELRIADRRAARFLVSALQAELFNETLRSRQAEIGLNSLEDGDLARVHRSGRLFWVTTAAEEQERADRLEISATGPLFGDKMRQPFGRAARWERAAADRAGVPARIRDGSWSRKGLRISGDRRALRAIARDLEVTFDGDIATVRVSLDSGCYASVLLEALFGETLRDLRSRTHDAADPDQSTQTEGDIP